MSKQKAAATQEPQVEQCKESAPAAAPYADLPKPDFVAPMPVWPAPPQSEKSKLLAAQIKDIRDAQEPRIGDPLLVQADATSAEVIDICNQALVALDLQAELAAAKLVVDEQANDPGLWFEAERITEAYLQAALRRLHAAIEERKQ